MSNIDALAATAIAGRVTVIDLADTDVTEVQILSSPDYGNLSVNPDNSLALVLTDTTQTTDLSFDVRLTHSDGTTEVKTVAIDVVEGSQQGGWGTGDVYMLETDSQNRVVVEHGENHRVVYVSGDDTALTIADIAAREGITPGMVNRKFFETHPEYGATPEMALAEDAGSVAWLALSGQGAKANSNWLLLERGYTYDNIKIYDDSLAGESELHPILISDYGTGERPIVTSNVHFLQSNTSNIVFQDLVFQGPDTRFSLLQGSNIILDNIVFDGMGMSVQNVDKITVRNTTVIDHIRETPISDVGFWDPGANRISAMFFFGTSGLLLEDNFIDHTGWGDGYSYDLDPSLPQPPSMFSQNIYIQTNNLDVTVRDNISMRAAADGMQIRSGGFIEDNLILDNNGGGMFGSGGDGNPGNYTLMNGNIITSAGHKTAASGVGSKAGGWVIQGEMPTMLDNILAHLANPNDPEEIAAKTRTDWSFIDWDQGRAPAAADTNITYNWGNKADKNTEGLDTEVLDQTTIQNFTAALLGKPDATIADLADYLRAQASGELDHVVDADLVIAFFRAGFGLETDLRAESTTLRFVPNELGDGVRWDNRLNWNSGDLPGTQDGDSVDLAGNLVYYGGTTVLAGLDFGEGGTLNVTHGKLTVEGSTSVGTVGATLKIDGAGQVWLGGYSDLDVLKVDAAGGRFVNTGISTGNLKIKASDNAQVILATDGGEYVTRYRSSLIITGDGVRIGFDGDQGGTAALMLTEGTNLRFFAEDGGLGTIREFHSGHYDRDGAGVRSGVNLGDATLEVDVSDIAPLGIGTYDLIHVDELIGEFGTVNIIGLASNQSAKLVINYTTDKVTLLLGKIGRGDGEVTVQKVGEAGDARADRELFDILVDGQGIYPDGRPDTGDSGTLKGSVGDDVLISPRGDGYIEANGGNDVVWGRDGHDNLFGGRGDDTLYGQRGRDFLFGQFGNDRLEGGVWRDVLSGGAGDDLLLGGKGNDRLTGGAGMDIFSFEEDFGRDRVTDFRIGMDKIKLDFDGADFDSLIIRGGPLRTVIETAQGKIVLDWVDHHDLTATDFLF